MADGDTDWYDDSESPMVLETWNDERWLTGLPHLSSRDDVYRGYFIPKGQINFQLRILLFFFFWEFTVNHLVHKDLRWWPMHGKVVWLSIANNLNVNLRNFQGNPSRPRDIPGPRGIQAGAFS